MNFACLLLLLHLFLRVLEIAIQFLPTLLRQVDDGVI